MNEAGKVNNQVVTRLRAKIVAKLSVEKSVRPRQVIKKPHGKTYMYWSSDPRNPNRDRRITLAMALVEARFGHPIEKLLSVERSGADVAASLGVTQACVSRWRLRMGLRTTTLGKGETQRDE